MVDGGATVVERWWWSDGGGAAAFKLWSSKYETQIMKCIETQNKNKEHKSKTKTNPAETTPRVASSVAQQFPLDDAKFFGPLPPGRVFQDRFPGQIGSVLYTAALGVYGQSTRVRLESYGNDGERFAELFQRCEPASHFSKSS